MQVTKKPNILKYKKALDKIQEKRALNPVIDTTIVEMINRTQSGKSFTGKEFKGYADSTKEARRKKGRVTNIVNLTDTGNMLHSMTFKAISGGIRIYFGTAIEKKKAYYNQKKRKFFGLSPQQRKAIRKYIKLLYRKQVSK